MLRPIHQLNASPISTATQPTQMMKLPGARLRGRQRRRGRRNVLARVAENLVGDRDHALRVAVDQQRSGSSTFSTPLTHWANVSA